jgi:hypothetical protein
VENTNPGEISGGVIETIHKADLHWIGTAHKHHRDGRARRLGS